MLKPGWRMMKAFLMHCDELEMYECLERISGFMTEYPDYVPKVWEMAELFFEGGRYRTAGALYEGIVAFPEHIHFDKLAIGHFRLLQIALKADLGDFYAPLRFIPFRNWLPETYALDGLLLLAKNFAVRGRWEEAEAYADELRTLAEAAYRKRRKPGLRPRYPLQRPSIAYYGEACLLKASSLEQQERYLEAGEWTKRYADLSRFADLDGREKREAERFRELARGNLLCIEVKRGNLQAVSDYTAFLQEHEDEVLPGLTALLMSANKYDYSIDRNLQLFSERNLEPVPAKDADDGERYYHERHRYLQHCCSYAEYCCRKARYEQGMEFTLRALELAIEEKNNGILLQCTILFEKYRDHFTSGQIALFEQLCEKITGQEPMETSAFRNYFLMLVGELAEFRKLW